MTVLEVTRFNLEELKEVTVTCRACGAKMIYALSDGGCHTATQCCRCKEKLGSYQNDFYLRDLAAAINKLKESDKVSIEFELVSDTK